MKRFLRLDQMRNLRKIGYRRLAERAERTRAMSPDTRKQYLQGLARAAELFARAAKEAKKAGDKRRATLYAAKANNLRALKRSLE